MKFRRFKRYKKIEKGLAQIDIAPLIDVVFQLLVFFMLTSSFVVSSGIEVNLPKAITSELLSKTEEKTVVINSEDAVFFGNKAVSITELKKLLQDASETHQNLTVIIKADKLSSLGRIIDVWDVCRQIGIEKINIAARQSDR